MEWPTPKNVSKIRSFMVLAGYYKRFIKNFSNIGHLITSMQGKGNKFEWTTQCVVSFEQLKQFLMNAPMLRIIDPDKDFLACKDACKEGLDGVLM